MDRIMQRTIARNTVTIALQCLGSDLRCDRETIRVSAEIQTVINSSYATQCKLHVNALRIRVPLSTGIGPCMDAAHAHAHSLTG